jgi:hypothetical protein
VKHVEVVAFSEKVLGPLQFLTPGLAFFRQKTFDHVAEALHTDPQVVPGFRSRLLRPTFVKLYNVTYLFEKQSRQAALVHTDELCPRRKTAQPALPFFPRKRF